MSQSVIAVYTRQDLTIADPDLLVTAARRLFPHDEALNDPETGPRAALVRLLIEHGADELAERADECGLRPGDSSVVLSEKDSVPPGTWARAFPGVPVAQPMGRLDTSRAFDG